MSSHNIPFLNIRKKIIVNYTKSATMGLVQGTQERVGNSCGKRAISIRAIEVLLYMYIVRGSDHYNFFFLNLKQTVYLP